MAVTLKAIAERVGVSPTAVSFALRGKNPGKRKLSEETVRRIKQAADEMGYRPNGIARRLVKGKTLGLGLVVWSEERIEEPLFPRFLKGISRACKDLGYTLELSIIYAEKENHIDRLLKQILYEKTVDGYVLIFVDEIGEEEISRLNDVSVPLVWIVRHSLEGKISNVCVETGEGYYEATRHLIYQDCKRIAFLAGDLRFQADREALNGYLRAVREFGLPEEPELVAEGNYRKEPSIVAAKKLLESKQCPDGIVAANDISAVQVLNVCAEKGLRVPEDISVIGYNDTSLAQLVEPQLSSMRVPAEKMGYEAISILVDRCLNNQEQECKHNMKIFVPELIVRDSSKRKAP